MNYICDEIIPCKEEFMDVNIDIGRKRKRLPAH